jgi:UDP-2,3-diacylglucosamine pyrophosphatase LpxH
LHGDEYDQVTTCPRWLSVLGDASYNLLVDLNRTLSWCRRKLGVGGHWSLADFAKRNLQGAASFVSRFERAVIHHAEGLQVDGVICGHIHTPSIKQAGDVLYLNCGDWVDSCTAIVEHLDGRMVLVRQDVTEADSGEHVDDFVEAMDVTEADSGEHVDDFVEAMDVTEADSGEHVDDFVETMTG